MDCLSKQFFEDRLHTKFMAVNVLQLDVFSKYDLFLMLEIEKYLCVCLNNCNPVILVPFFLSVFISGAKILHKYSM